MANTTTDDSKKCAFLALPAELRNTIYDYCLEEAHHPPNTDIKLDHARLPTGALALTCRQIHKEYLPMYDSALHDFFTTHTFAIPLSKHVWTGSSNYPSALVNIRDKDLAQVTRYFAQSTHNFLLASKHEMTKWNWNPTVGRTTLDGGVVWELYADWCRVWLLQKCLQKVVDGREGDRSVGFTKSELGEAMMEWFGQG